MGIEPNEIYYKLTENSNILKINIDSIALFELPGYVKYICKEVKIDRASEDISNLSSQKNPVWQTEKLALKVLTEGKASLYMYSGFNLTRFFYSVDDSSVQQLIFKSYWATNANGTNYVATNTNFRQQLFAEVSNPSYKYDVAKLNYEEKELKTYFEQYNAQFEPKNTSTTKEKVKRDSFKAAVMVGINHSNLSVTNRSDARYSKEFGPAISPMFGAEFEFILPFFNNKWSFLLQPVYNSRIFVKTQPETHPHGGLTDSEYSYQGIDIPLESDIDIQ